LKFVRHACPIFFAQFSRDLLEDPMVAMSPPCVESLRKSYRCSVKARQMMNQSKNLNQSCHGSCATGIGRRRAVAVVPMAKITIVDTRREELTAQTARRQRGDRHYYPILQSSLSTATNIRYYSSLKERETITQGNI
jgi:hypothetical protein